MTRDDESQLRQWQRDADPIAERYAMSSVTFIACATWIGLLVIASIVAHVARAFGHA